MKTLFLIVALVAGAAFDARAYTTVTYQTYGVANSPFIMTQEKITTTGYDEGGTKVEYQYYLDVKPAAAHENLQRIEYAGFRVVYQTGVRYYQLFPGGGIRELTDINQALYEPSYYVVQPGSIGRYQLFSQPIPDSLQGVAGTVCLNGISFFNAPDPDKILGVNFMAGYGFLTQENVDLINRQKAMENNPVMQQQPGFKLLDIQTMQWAIAQSNMFQKNAYYNIFDLTNTCQGNLVEHGGK
ncbi:MAG: hypothetical protein KKE44_10020 [Proteobacteria bacterium]|nr:hypothetical protein [Pseudomonadota bacterium]MBU1583058.1 hypothetical protein [Pseudomonadota bacterium]MBU2452887.1 hypothetical protein [Pseudomonadota bacterium]MBU2631676.1 hypothetical protein [Pseudomonadota bacterium]